MKKTLLIVCLSALAFSCKDKAPKETKEAEATTENIIKEEPKENEWTVLFDGSNLDNLKLYGNNNAIENWKIEDDALVFYPPTDRPKDTYYNLVTKEEYTNFVLSIDWKISEGGNSGIFWGIKDDGTYGQPYETGLEVQVLDNKNHPDAKNGTDRQAGALYDMVAPSKDATKPVGEWNTAVITINHKTNKGSSVLNGVTVAEFPLNGKDWDNLLKNSKFNGWDGFAKYKTGKIGVQDHGNIVSYRNIKIKELD
ncbi:MAG: 3-keto-disaccharide hydrolase [Cellulophaga sp.]